MSVRMPPRLAEFCRRELPILLGACRGRRMVDSVVRIVASDRWNSFDRFRHTTEMVAGSYETAGARVEIDQIPTGGRIGSGRWVIHEAADVKRATVDIIHPCWERLLDYAQNPWHVVQWSSSTPSDGIVSSVMVIDSEEELRRLPPQGLVGQTVLTRLSPRGLLRLLADRGAVGVISDYPVPNNPDAIAWKKFGWGGLPAAHSGARLVGLMISANQGQQFRRLVAESGPLSIKTRVIVHKYAGHHDVVSGCVRGAGNPEEEVWALAHSSEPGAIDNASGVAASIEIATALEELIAAGKLERPRRSIRFLHAYECYGFFAYLEQFRGPLPPLAGVVIDAVGAAPTVCNGRLEWHATIPMSAGFVNRVGAAILRSALRQTNPGYKLSMEPFMSTADTLVGDPKYGFPCPWLSTHHQQDGVEFDAYHSSADLPQLLSLGGLKTCAGAMAGYLYYLANATSRDVVQLATTETEHTLRELASDRRRRASSKASRAAYLKAAHEVNIEKLKHWMWGGDRKSILGHLDECERFVEEAVAKASSRTQKRRVSANLARLSRRVPRRTALLAPDSYNTPPDIQDRINASRLPAWTLFWADGHRSIAEIAEKVVWETTAGRPASGVAVDALLLERLVNYFHAHQELGYVTHQEPGEMVTCSSLVADLRELGLTAGMDVMVHSSLSRIGIVKGGAPTVVSALLQVIGRTGTLMMPSFNHRLTGVFNPLTTLCANGAIPDVAWRRTDAVRSLHPTHPVCAIGPRAAEFCRNHLENGIWSATSPIGRLIHGGGFLLSLGVKHDTSTAYHVAEMSVPCGCLDAFSHVDRIVDVDGQLLEVSGFAWRDGNCPVELARMDQSLNRRGLQRRGKIGQADSTLVLAKDLWTVRREHLKSVCPTCTIKPEKAS